jgi:hypothetical protein
MENTTVTEQAVPIGGHIPINLVAQDASKVTPQDLKTELDALYLRCPDTEIDKLQGYINAVRDRLPPEGGLTAIGFSEYKAGFSAEDYGTLDTTALTAEDITTELEIQGPWKPTDFPPCSGELEVIGFPPHFDLLLQRNTPPFGGHKGEQKSSGIGTVESLKNLFTSIAYTISGQFVSELDKASMEAAFVKTIDAATLPTDTDLDIEANRSIKITTPPYRDKNGQMCVNGFGVCNVSWKLHVDNYKRKSKDGGNYNQYNLTVTVRAVTYTDEETAQHDAEYVTTLLKDKLFFANPLSIPVPTHIDVFPSLPPECADTYQQGLPLETGGGDYCDVIILYHAGLNNIGCLDNTDSDCTAGYSRSITSGFTFSTGHKLNTGMNFSVEAGIVSAGVTVDFEISFNEQWNTSQTEALTFTVPGGSAAYLYQGYIGSAVLRHDLNTNTYSYTDYATFQSNLVVTSATRLNKADLTTVMKRSPSAVGANGKLPLWRRYINRE